jgi:hypothetical protein
MDPDYLMFRELLRRSETDAELKAEMCDLIGRYAPMAEFRMLYKRTIQSKWMSSTHACSVLH